MDIQSAKDFSDEIVNMFLDKPLIVIAEVNVIMKKQPIASLRLPKDHHVQI